MTRPSGRIKDATLPWWVSFQFRGADLDIAHVIARSEATKQSLYPLRRRLLRCARNDILEDPPEYLKALILWLLRPRF